MAEVGPRRLLLARLARAVELSPSQEGVVALTRIFTVTAERGRGDWWVLEAPDVGAVSQVRRLDQVEDEMREAIAYPAGLPESESEVEVDVRATLPEDCVEHVGQARRGGCARGRWGSWVGCCRAVDGRGGAVGCPNLLQRLRRGSGGRGETA